MIFVTVGSMMPFDRLILAMDAFALGRAEERFLAQIGNGRFEPRNMEFTRMMSPRAFAEAIAAARLVIAHAGTGSVISALDAGRPIVLLPRRKALAEVTTDHQLATVRWLAGRGGVHVALEDTDLPEVIEHALSDAGTGPPAPTSGPEAAFAGRLREALS